MNKRPKKETFPAIEGLECIKRISGGTGFSRFEARMPASGAVGELVTIDTPKSLDRQWIQTIVEQDDNPWPPVIMSNQGQPAWVLFQPTQGEPLDKLVDELSAEDHRLVITSIAVQCWVILAQTHGRGIGHGKVSASTFRLARNDDGYPDVRLSNWQPPASDTETIIQSDLDALSDLTQMLLTKCKTAVGSADTNLTPSEDSVVDAMPTMDELIDSALAAPRPDSARTGLERLAPILEQALAHRFRETQEIFDSESTFIDEVEQQRIRLRELETHRRFIRDWLYERDEQIELAEDKLSQSKSNLRSLDNLRMRIDLSISTLNAPSPALLGNMDSFEQSHLKYDLEDFGISEAPPEIPAEPIEAETTISTMPIGRGRPSHLGSRDVRIGLGPVLGFIIVLVLVGGFAGAWFLRTNTAPMDKPVTQSHGESTTAVEIANQQPKADFKTASETPIENEKRPTPPAAKMPPEKDGLAHSKQNSSAATDPSDSGVMVKHVDGHSKTASVRDAAVLHDAGRQSQPIDASPRPLEGLHGQTAESTMNAPQDMVFVSKGVLRLGLNAAQAARLESMCKRNRNTPAMRADCSAIKKEIGDDELQLDSFLLDKYEVAQGRFEDCVKAGICQQRRPFFDVSHFPATGVSYINAKRYCSFVKKRLPTIEELQYATRGSKGSNIYPWGDESPSDPSVKRANLGQFKGELEAPNSADGFKYAAPVKAFDDISSPFGAINLAGNVREWTQSKSTRGMYAFGGGWISASDRLRVTRKDDLTKNMARGDLGFRCARSIGPNK
ncbi:MAG: SUMF1/EgtB/PvdO family nonheme iron enzyme [Myxococcota bacterium]|nr:SUMF1/EgtB/PvdO family nonheme iron enzyme [Myxococcota bacterium]